jgi:hypothetical protein
MQNISYKLPATSYKLQTRSFNLYITGVARLRLAACGLQLGAGVWRLAAGNFPS